MKRRVVRSALGSAVFALAILVIPLAIVAVVLFVGQARQTLEHDALAAALAVSPSYSTGDPVELDPSVGSDVGVYNLTGEKVSGTGPLQWDGVTAQASQGKLIEGGDATEMVVAEPVSNNESVIAVVRSARPWSSITEGAIAICLIILLVAAGVVGVTYLFARRVGAALSRPVERLAVAAAAFGDGELTVPEEWSGVDEIDEVRRALRLSAGKLNELLTRERRVSSNASHQLRTPLTGMRARLETSLKGNADAQTNAIIESIATIDRLDSTIDDILALTKGPITAPIVPISDLIERVIERWRPHYDIVGRPLRSRIEDEAAEAQTPRSMTESVLDVLFDNALIHGLGETMLIVREAHGVTAIDVINEGHATTSVDFFVDGVSESGGTGLGLGIAQRTAQDHGARLVLATTAPVTRFTLLIPKPTAGSLIAK